MRPFLLLVPAGLSALALGAHFLRRGQVAGLVACLALFALLFVRRAWAARTVQIGMLVAALVWAQTLHVLLPARRALGEPWVRTAIILGAVAAAALLSAAAFETRTLRARFGLRASSPPGGTDEPAGPS
jgi:hypothetical protein